MSYTSSAASATSCVLQGKVVTVEEALDQVTRDAQGRLTDLQIALRNLCAAEEQEIDEVEDYKNAVSLADDVEDFVSGLAELLGELPQIARDIVGPCPAECRDWLSSHKDARRAQAKLKKERGKVAAKERKEAVRGLKAISE